MSISSVGVPHSRPGRPPNGGARGQQDGQLFVQADAALGRGRLPGGADQ